MKKPSLTSKRLRAALATQPAQPKEAVQSDSLKKSVLPHETPIEIDIILFFVFFVVVLLFVTLSLSLRFIIALNLPFRVLGSWQQTSRIKRMQLQTRQGLLALADGQNVRAEKKLAELAPTTSQPVVVLPGLARALGWTRCNGLAFTVT